MCHTQELYLGDNQISDAGAAAIAEALKKMGGGAASPESDDGIDVK